MRPCTTCEVLTEGSKCPRCVERIVAVGELSELAAAQQVRRQRILDLDLGEHDGCRLILEFVAPYRTHFDLGIAMLGNYQWIDAGAAQLPRLHGAWDAVDAAGTTYRGLGEGGSFERGYGAGLVRFIPTNVGSDLEMRPAPGPTLLTAMNRGRPLLEVQVGVPGPAPWER